MFGQGRIPLEDLLPHMGPKHIDDEQDVYGVVDEGDGVVKVGIAAAQMSPKVPIRRRQHGREAQGQHRYRQRSKIYQPEQSMSS